MPDGRNAFPVDHDTTLGLLALNAARTGVYHGGATGPTGPTGPLGPTGSPGPTGSVSPTGNIGVPGVSAICAEVRLAFTTSNTSSSLVIPAGAVIWYASVTILTAYDNGAKVLVGNATVPNSLMGASDSDLSMPSKYEVSLDVDSIADAPCLVSVLGAPTMGSAICVVRYFVPV